MTRAFKYRLHPNKKQAAVLVSWLGMCRSLYNAALQQKIEAYRLTGKSPSRYDQCKGLTELRGAFPEWAAVSALVERSALKKLDFAYQSFFRRVKQGAEKPGFPRFKGRDRYHSFGIGRVEPQGNKIRIPNLGLVKFNRYRPLGGPVRDATLRFTAGKWYVSFVCDVGEATAKISVRSMVGIDVGLTSFATLSTGEAVENPRYFRKGAAALAKRRQSLEKKLRGSRGRERAKGLVAKAHEHIKNQRTDHARKLACALFGKFDLVAFEDLQISGMVQGSNLSKSITDAAWGIFRHCLEAKAENAGKWAVPVDPRNTTQDCSRCGQRVPKTLADRTHSCPCGYVAGRDLNAAENILARGLRAVGLQPAEA